MSETIDQPKTEPTYRRAEPKYRRTQNRFQAHVYRETMETLSRSTRSTHWLMWSILISLGIFLMTEIVVFLVLLQRPAKPAPHLQIPEAALQIGTMVLGMISMAAISGFRQWQEERRISFSEKTEKADSLPSPLGASHSMRA